MRIDIIPKKVTGKGIPDTTMIGVRYAFAYADGTEGGWGDVSNLYETAPKWSWFQDNAISVLFDKKSLDEFCPSLTVKEFINRLEDEKKRKIAEYNQLLKKGKKALSWFDRGTKEIVDFHQIYTERRDKLLNVGNVIFVEITFV